MVSIFKSGWKWRQNVSEGQIDLLQDLPLPSQCGIRIAKLRAVKPKWKCYCKLSGKVPWFLERGAP